MSRELFMLFLVSASMLGAVMGACLWSFRRQNGGGDGEVNGQDKARQPGSVQPGTARGNERAAAWQPEPVDRHAEAQSRRIVSLVAELQAAEEQQMRLQRDLATLRASRQHGGETMRPRLLDGEDDLPVLNRRVEATSSDAEWSSARSGGNSLQAGPGSELLGLSLALDSTAEIPVMSEEELAVSIDDLELEFIDEGDSKHG